MFGNFIIDNFKQFGAKLFFKKKTTYKNNKKKIKIKINSKIRLPPPPSLPLLPPPALPSPLNSNSPCYTHLLMY